MTYREYCIVMCDRCGASVAWLASTNELKLKDLLRGWKTTMFADFALRSPETNSETFKIHHCPDCARHLAEDSSTELATNNSTSWGKVGKLTETKGA